MLYRLRESCHLLRLNAPKRKELLELLLPPVVAFIMQRLGLDVALSSGRGAEKGRMQELDQHWQGHRIRTRLGGHDADVERTQAGPRRRRRLVVSAQTMIVIAKRLL